MDLTRIHILLLFVSFALAFTVLIDGIAHLSEGYTEYEGSEKTDWTNLMMYEIIVPVLSVFGLLMHIFGLHLDVIGYTPETSTEGLFVVIGTVLHGGAWLAIGSMWTACEVGTMHVQSTTTANGQQLNISRGGPDFCPYHNFWDEGYKLDATMPKVKLAFGWILFVLTLASMFCACRGYMEAKHARYTGEGRGDMKDNEAQRQWQPAPVGIPGGYEAKI